MDSGTGLPSAAKDPPSSPSPDVTKSGDVAGGDSEAGHNWPKDADNNDDDGSRVRDAAGFLWSVLTTPSYYLITILLFFTISATIGTGIAAVDNTSDTIIEEGGNAVNSLLNTVSSSGDGSDAGSGQESAEPESESDGILSGPDSEINQTRVERAVHRRINEIRADRGLNPLRWDGRLQSIAEGHSTDMATNDYFSHSSPQGENFEDRYAKAGYECRVPIDGNQYSVGGENIAYTYAEGDLNTDHRGIVNYHNNETAIGRGVVNGWMHSSGHRENILESHWQHEGIGVAVSGNKIYVTQNFC